MKVKLLIVILISAHLCQAQFNLDSIKSELNKTQVDTVRVALLYDIGLHFLRVNYDSALFYLNMARPSLSGPGIGELKPKIHNLMQFAYRSSGMYDSALASLQVIRKHNIDTHQDYNLGLCYFNMGWVYKFKGQYEEAIQNFLMAFKVFESVNDLSRMAHVEISIGNIYGDEKLYDQAYKNFSRALNFAEEAGDSLQTSNALSSMGNVHFAKGEFTEALIYYERNLTIKEHLSNPAAIARAIGRIGKVYAKLETYEKAIDEYNKALEIFEELGERLGIARTKNALGEAYMMLGQNYIALDHITEAADIFTKIDVRLDLSANWHLMARNYYALGEFKKGYDAYEQYHHLRDSLFTAEKTEQIARLEEQFEAEKRSKEIAVLNQENQIKTTTIRQQELQGYAYIGGILIVIVIAALIYSRYRDKRKAADVLEEKNQIISRALDDKETLLKEIHHRVKNNLQIIESLLNLQNEWKGTKRPEELLKLSQDRIHAISAIHDKLYQSSDLGSIDFKTYTEDLVSYFKESYETSNLTIKSYVEEVNLDLDQLIPCGLILNELITNSIKYAFVDGQKGAIDVSGYASDDGKYCLEVMDNGIGLKEDFDPVQSDSLGFKLVESLSNQLNGVFEIIKGPGANFKVTFAT